MNGAPPLDRALGAWSSALGPEHVITDVAALDRVSSATFATTARATAVLRPGSRADVQACMRIANSSRTPVYPVSGGRNWGLGSRVPPRDAVVMDLGRMNAISAFSERSGVVTVEPGVTFRQLHAFLSERGARYLLPVIGGPADASVIGNVVERGDAAGPYGARDEHVGSVEVVLPTGEYLRTGFGRFGETAVSAVHPAGVGPALAGLFVQSNLGITTAATMLLVRRPAVMLACTFAVSDVERLGAAVDMLREAVAAGTIAGNGVTLWNAAKAFAGFEHPAQPHAADELRAWYGCVALAAGTREEAEAKRRVVERALQPAVDELRWTDADSAPELAGSPLMGVPSDDNLRSAYRRKPGVPPTFDLDRDRCGLLWVCPVLPLDGDAIVRAMSVMHDTIVRGGFEPQIGMSIVSPRALHAFASIVYDRDVPGDDERALRAHDALLEALVAEGFLPYRLALPAMDALPTPQDDYGTLMQNLKHALDPNDVLAPGRYDFRSTWPAR